MHEVQEKKFQAQLLHDEQYLRKIKELGIDTSKLEAIILKIKEELNNKIKATNETNNIQEMINNYLQVDNLEKYYLEALKLLKELERKIIEEYNTCAKIDGICQEIESQLDTITEKNMDNFLTSIKIALNLCNTPSTGDYKNKELLFEKVYELAYQIIKKEIILTNQSELLTYINASKLDAPYLEKIILREIDSLNLSRPENKDIVTKLISLKCSGLEYNHLDSELIYLLATRKEAYETYNNNKDIIITLDSKLNENNNKISQLESNGKLLLTKIKDQKKNVKRNLRRFLHYTGILTTYTTVCLSLAIGGFLLVDKKSKRKIYPTTEKIYDIKTQTYLTQEYYSDSLKDTTQLITYNTWEKNTDQDTFEREVLTYDLSTIEYKDLSNYMEQDLTDLKILEREIESKSRLNPEDLYKEAYSIIKKITNDKTEYEFKRDTSLFWYCAMIYICFLIEEIICAYIFYKEKIYSSGPSHCLKELKDFLNSLKEYQEELKEQTIKNQELNELVNISNQLLQTLEQEYSQLPEYMQQDEELKNILKKERKLTNP